jgi:hypothetical protein
MPLKSADRVFFSKQSVSNKNYIMPDDSEVIGSEELDVDMDLS